MAALNYCTEAAVRQFLVENKIHIDPISPPKWVPVEVDSLPAGIKSGMAGLSLVPCDASLPPDIRFGQLRELWEMYA